MEGMKKPYVPEKSFQTPESACVHEDQKAVHYADLRGYKQLVVLSLK